MEDQITTSLRKKLESLATTNQVSLNSDEASLYGVSFADKEAEPDG